MLCRVGRLRVRLCVGAGFSQVHQDDEIRRSDFSHRIGPSKGRLCGTQDFYSGWKGGKICAYGRTALDPELCQVESTH